MFRRIKNKLKKLREETGKGLLELAAEDFENWKKKQILKLVEWEVRKMDELKEKERRLKNGEE